MDIASHTFTQGQALVLVGPQGCGKSTIARQIATHHGAFVEVEFRQLMQRREINRVLASAPKTVIVDGLPPEESAYGKIKSLIANENIYIRPYAGRRRCLVKTPNFIFCTGEADPFFDSSRRFFVIRLENRK